MIYTIFYAKDMREAWMKSCNNNVKTIDKSGYEEITIIDAKSLSDVFKLMNVVDGDELPTQLMVRSLSVGDIVVEANGKASLCAPMGWTKVEFK